MKLWTGLVALLILTGCGKQAETSYEPEFAPRVVSGKHFIVGILPQHNVQRLMELNVGLVEQINTAIPEAHFEMEASRSFEEFEKKLFAGHFDFAMLNPYQTILSLKYGYRVFAKMGDDAIFHGIVLVRKDSGVNKITDLKGKRVAYPANTALAAGLMPQYYFHTNGIDVNRDIENVYVGSQESAIMNVVLGHTVAGATWPPPWKRFNVEHPDLASQLEVKWETPPLLNNGWVVRNNVDADIAAKFGNVLVNLDKSEQGKKALAPLLVSRFERADDATYEPVRKFLKQFSATVRPVEQ
ncbi:MAG: PhnD/SsuA/transferrin family substrate-binding protein [Gallionellaceae bacterium]